MTEDWAIYLYVVVQLHWFLQQQKKIFI